jgi:hypothetical protein
MEKTAPATTAAVIIESVRTRRDAERKESGSLCGAAV